jgi:hypothetical protein
MIASERHHRLDPAIVRHAQVAAAAPPRLLMINRKAPKTALLASRNAAAQRPLIAHGLRNLQALPVPEDEQAEE